MIIDQQTQIKLSRLGCSFATDFKYRNASESEQKQRFLDRGYSIEIVDQWFIDCRNRST